MSITSSASWNAIPIFSPNWVTISLSLSEAPESIAPNRAEAEISEPVLSATTLR